MARFFVIGAVIFVCILGIYCTNSTDAFAHKSGCHRWHSCPSDTGSYVCGDIGYCSQCPDNNYCKAGQAISGSITYSGSTTNPSSGSSSSSVSKNASSRTSNAIQKQLVPSGCKSVNGLPDSKCTSGSTNPNVNQNNIQGTICKSGYTKTIRPPVSYTDPLKIKLMSSYGLKGSAGDYELDHLIPLELGGNPTDVKNLWPEPWNGINSAKEKDKFENYLHGQVCSGKMSLGVAQHEIATNWSMYWNISH